jgi:glutamate---cysteine ligase / carboxylate-amine ligase
MTFHASPRHTLGVEVELGIVDQQTLRLVSESDDVLEAMLADGPYDGMDEHPKAKHEFYSSSIEIITGICEDTAEARSDLAETTDEVTEAMAPMGLALQPGGGHPEEQWRDLVVTHKPRYQEFADWIQWPARRSMCHGIHYHVGVNGGDAAVAIANALAVSIPLLLGPSASSPFWHGYDTGLASARTKVFEGMPTADLPPELEDYAHFERLMADMHTAGAIRTVRELWWDIRPHPGFGTIEARVCDTMGTLEEIVAMAALTQCLVTDLNRRFDEGKPLPRLPRWALKENKWRAARWGIEAQIVVRPDGATRSLRDVLADELERLAPVADELGCSADLASVAGVAADPGYERQRRWFAMTGELHEVTRNLVSHWP